MRDCVSAGQVSLSTRASSRWDACNAGEGSRVIEVVLGEKGRVKSETHG